MVGLAVDPSLTRTGGSILGDKTRMERLTTDPAAFVRPSPPPAPSTVSRRRPARASSSMEAAGYDVVRVETVGVGPVRNRRRRHGRHLSAPGPGPHERPAPRNQEGRVLELADVIAVNKTEGPHERDARATARELSGALRLLRTPDAVGSTPVLTCSALRLL